MAEGESATYADIILEFSNLS